MTGLFCPGCNVEFGAITKQPQHGDVYVCNQCAEPSVYVMFQLHNIPVNSPLRTQEVIDAQAETFTAGLDRALAKLNHPTGR